MRHGARDVEVVFQEKRSLCCFFDYNICLEDIAKSEEYLSGMKHFNVSDILSDHQFPIVCVSRCVEQVDHTKVWMASISENIRHDRFKVELLEIR